MGKTLGKLALSFLVGCVFAVAAAVIIFLITLAPIVTIALLGLVLITQIGVLLIDEYKDWRGRN